MIASVIVVSACTQSGTTDPTAPVTPPTATTGHGGGCDPGITEPVPAEAESMTRSEGDFDGNGEVDVVEVYLLGDEWRARLVLDDGYTVVVPLGKGAIAYPLGGLDLDGSGDELLTVIGSGASTTIVGIYSLFDCDLAPVLGATGAPVAIPIGASAVNQSGLRCLPGVGIDVFTQMTSDGITYEQTIERFRLTDGRLVSAGSATETLTSPDDQTRILDASRFDCGDLSL
jgi:hypothetical protein